MSKSYIDSCRFCLKKFLQIQNRVNITEEIKDKFASATNIHLKNHELLPEFYCLQCDNDLKVCIEIKEKFTSNQRILEDFIPLEDELDIKPDILLVKTEVMDFENENEAENEETIEDKVEYEKYVDRSVSPEYSDGIKKLSCKGCGNFFSSNNIKKHYERVHMKVKNFKCNLCNKTFYGKGNYTSHMKNLHEGTKDEECLHCGMSFSTKSALQFHVRLKHENRYEQSCPFCNKICNTKSRLDDHIRSKHTKDRKYACPIEGCDKKYFTCADMITHKKNSHRPNRECPLCPAKVKNLKRHMETHSNHSEKPARKIQQINKVSCEICGKEYRMDCIKKHFDRVHMKLKRYFCDYCGKSFYGKLGLESHIKIHELKKTLECPEANCDLKFYDKMTLMGHIRLSHERRYQKTCEICGKTCVNKSRLEDHIRSQHTGERKYACPIEDCDKRFFTCSDMITHKKKFHKAMESCLTCRAEVKNLKNHMKLHEEKLVCRHIEENGIMCNKQYMHNYQLQQHIQLQHLGIRKHTCPHCQSTFGTRSVLNGHVRSVHEQRRMKCELCEYLTTRKSYYMKHVAERHRELDEQTRKALLDKIRKARIEDLYLYNKS